MTVQDTKTTSLLSPRSIKKAKKKKSFKSLMRGIVQSKAPDDKHQPAQQTDASKLTPKELARRGLGSGAFSKIDTI